MSDEEVQKTAFVGRNVTEADIVKGLLETNGIPAVVVGGSMVSMLDGMVTGNEGVAVQVPASRIEDAKRIIEANYTPVEDEDFGAEDADD